jgi:hypothetical protein
MMRSNFFDGPLQKFGESSARRSTSVENSRLPPTLTHHPMSSLSRNLGFNNPGTAHDLHVVRGLHS